jgi:hypothetical protein
MAILDEPIKGMPTAKNCINGEWVESKGEIIEVTRPPTNPSAEWAFPPVALRADIPRNFIIIAKKKAARFDKIKSLL